MVELVGDGKVSHVSFSSTFSYVCRVYLVYLLLNTMFFPLQDVEELMSLAPEKILLRWMNFQLKKGGFKRTMTNFSSDVKVSLSTDGKGFYVKQ